MFSSIDEQVRARSRGRVRSPESYHPIYRVPQKDGLYCTSIFGPVDWDTPDVQQALQKLESQNMNYEDFDEARRKLFSPRIQSIACDDRTEHCGHIELTRPVARPDGASRGVLLVVPPRYRHYRLLAIEEHRAKARARRAELLALADTEWPYEDSLETLLVEEGLDSAEAIESLAEGLEEHPLDTAYRWVMNLDRRIRRLVELGAPEELLDSQAALLRTATESVDAEVSRVAALPPSLQAYFK